MNNISKKQSDIWAGKFGDEYISRNYPNEQQINLRLKFWKKILNKLQDKPKSLLEVGPNAGMNLRALKSYNSKFDLHAVEPNKKAMNILVDDNIVKKKNIQNGSCEKIDKISNSIDFVFTWGVLIHIEPEKQKKSIEEIYRVSNKYILCVEYFSDKLEYVNYRNSDTLLVKRDFGSLYLDCFSDLEVIDYGFTWKKFDNLDNSNWWIFKKKG